ncbi:hypothetical protein [Ferroplasma sp.]|uniref:hypothetical protein n=1 Tax=Ferroplasma sp. TaxID=2591003 RepID=UPI002616D387|nr:hypothetical protein [Ferroplasma sp.]
MDNNLGNIELTEHEKLVMFQISRIQKAPSGCFALSTLKKKHKIQKENINTESILEKLMKKKLIYKGNKKDMWCLSPAGKKMEHEIEKSRLDDLPYKVTRNKSNL